MTTRGLPLQERFDMYVSPEPNTGCYLWMGFGDHGGYGCFAIDSSPVKAHRVSYELACGPIPEGLHVLHKCDVRCCVNPDHLFLGTNDDNVKDKVAKGRQARDRSMGKVKLTPEQVHAIRRESGTHRLIGLKYGIGRSQVRRIQLGEAWAHLK
jgi:hypothetical protein